MKSFNTATWVTNFYDEEKDKWVAQQLAPEFSFSAPLSCKTWVQFKDHDDHFRLDGLINGKPLDAEIVISVKGIHLGKFSTTLRGEHKLLVTFDLEIYEGQILCSAPRRKFLELHIDYHLIDKTNKKDKEGWKRHQEFRWSSEPTNTPDTGSRGTGRRAKK